jgi:phospholipid transport system substrate-binding protein
MFSVSRRLIMGMALVAPLVVMAAPSRADAPADAFVEDLVNRALKLIANKQMPAAERDQAFAKLLSDNFDIPRIARFVLGRYWTGASDDERTKFIATYRDFVVQSYASQFSSYSGETVKVTSSRPESDDVTIVNSDIDHPNGDPPVQVAWRVHKTGDRFQVVDVDVAGVSMMITQREEFASVIEHGGGTVAGLTQAIQQKLKSGDLNIGG